MQTEDNIPEDKEQDRSQYVAEAASYVTPYFKPALDRRGATDLFTTHEVWQSIVRLNPNTNVSEGDVFTMLEEHCFLYQPDDTLLSLEYKWLMVRIR